MRTTTITCDALVHGPGEWLPCGAKTNAERPVGWVLGKRGDFCRRHAPLAAGFRVRGAL